MKCQNERVKLRIEHLLRNSFLNKGARLYTAPSLKMALLIGKKAKSAEDSSRSRYVLKG